MLNIVQIKKSSVNIFLNFLTLSWQNMEEYTTFIVHFKSDKFVYFGMQVCPFLVK